MCVLCFDVSMKLQLPRLVIRGSVELGFSLGTFTLLSCIISGSEGLKKKMGRNTDLTRVGTAENAGGVLEDCSI